MMTYEFVILMCLFFFFIHRQNETRQWCRNIEKAFHERDRDIARLFNDSKKIKEGLLSVEQLYDKTVKYD